MNPQTLAALEHGHQVCHSTPDNPDETVHVELTQREFNLVALGLALIQVGWPDCIGRNAIALVEKMGEVLAAQKGDEAVWSIGPENLNRPDFEI